MTKSAMVSVDDAMKVIDLCKDLARMPAGMRRAHLADQMCKCFSAQVGVVNDGKDFRAGGNPRLGIPVARGWMGEPEQRVFERYLRSADHAVDPAIKSLAVSSHRVRTRRRVQLASDREWNGTKYVSEDRRSADVDDVIYSVIHAGQPSDPRSGEIQFLAVHRPWGDRIRFSKRDLTLMSLLHEAAGPLVRIATLAPGLAPRLERVVDLLRTGLSEKEIALQLGLTPNTVHGYVKEIYSILHVSSRAEFMVAKRAESNHG